MKIRLDFVTNSSSSSFVCIQFNSKKIKELLTKYNVKWWESSSEWDVYYDDEDISCTAVPQNDIGSTLDWFMEELLLMMNSDNNYIEEYRANRQAYIDDVMELYYEINDHNRDEFDGAPEKHDYFEYTKGVISEKTIKQCLKNLKDYCDWSVIKPSLQNIFMGEGHLQQATDESEIVLVREPDNTFNPNAIFIEEVPHKYLGYMWSRIADNLAPILDSGQYLYRAGFDNETKTVHVDIAKKDIEEHGWKRIETGSPQITDEELCSVRESFNRWLTDLKTKYEGKKKPATVDTLIKNGGIKKNVIQEWAKALYKEDLAVVLSNEELLNTKTKMGVDLTKWDKGNESDDQYYERIRCAIEEKVSPADEIEFAGKTFVNLADRYGGWARTDPRNPILLTIKNAGGVFKNEVTGKTDYVIIDTSDRCSSFVRNWSTVLKNIDKGNELIVISLKDFESITGLDEERAEAALRELYHPTADNGWMYYAEIDK